MANLSILILTSSCYYFEIACSIIIIIIIIFIFKLFYEMTADHVTKKRYWRLSSQLRE